MSGAGGSSPSGAGAEAMGRRDWLAVACALAVAAVLRIVFLRETAAHPLYQALTGDPALYHRQALDVLGGRPAPDHAYFHSSPLYPFVLAALLRIGGGSLTAVRAVQSAVGIGTVLLIARLAAAAFGRRAAVAAAWLAALYVPFIFFESEVLEIAWVLAFVTGMLLLLARRRSALTTAAAAAAGALLGLASLGKPNLLLFAPVGSALIMAGAMAGEREAPPRAERQEAWGRRAAPAVVFFVVTGLMILPATVHNLRTSGDLIPVSSNGGINLYIGNHAGASGMFQVPPEMRLDLLGSSTRAAEREAGRRLSAGEVSDHWARKAFAYMRSQPGSWLALMARKTALFWNAYEIPNHYHFYFVRGFAPVLRIPLSTFGVVAPLGLLGLCLAAGRRRPHAPLLIAYGATFMVSVVLFFITARYRLAVAPVLLAAAGYALTELWAFAREAKWRSLAGAGAVLAALAVGVNVPMVEFGFAQMHNTVGAILGDRGDYVDAAAEFRRAVEEDPDNISAHYNLGVALVETGDLEEAARAFERATRLYPGYREARAALAATLERIERAREADGSERRSE